MIKRLKKHKIVLFALALVLCFGAKVFDLGSEVGSRVVVTGIGIDKDGENYRVSAQVFTPQIDGTKTQKKSVVTADGKTIGFAVAQLSLKTGRVATASHCKLIVLGQSLLTESVLDPLNYFVTDLEINWGAVVVATNGKAEETISGLNELEQNAEFNWQEFLNNNREVDVIAVNSIRELMLQSQDRSKSFLLTVMNVEKKQSGSSGSSGGSSGSDGSGGSGSGSSGGGEQATLKAGERTAVFYDGKLSGEIGMREIRGYSWLDRDVKKADFEVATNDGLAVVRLKNKFITVRCSESDGVPVMTVRLNLYFDVTDLPGEIFQQGDPAPLEQAIARAVREDVLACDKASRELGVDLLCVNDRFYRFAKRIYDRHGDSLFEKAEIDLHVKATLSVT